MRGQPKKESQNRTARMRLSGQGKQNRKYRTGMDSQNWTTRMG